MLGGGEETQPMPHALGTCHTLISVQSRRGVLVTNSKLGSPMASGTGWWNMPANWDVLKTARGLETCFNYWWIIMKYVYIYIYIYIYFLIYIYTYICIYTLIHALRHYAITSTDAGVCLSTLKVSLGPAFWTYLSLDIGPNHRNGQGDDDSDLQCRGS